MVVYSSENNFGSCYGRSDFNGHLFTQCVLASALLEDRLSKSALAAARHTTYLDMDLRIGEHSLQGVPPQYQLPNPVLV